MVAWWHPEEIPFLSRGRSIIPFATLMTISKNKKNLIYGGMVPP